jgi:MFS family permease
MTQCLTATGLAVCYVGRTALWIRKVNPPTRRGTRLRLPLPRGAVISQETAARPPREVPDGQGPEPSRGATFAEVFAVGEFRALWLAQVLSVAGDQLARVALTLLVFDRTHSALLAAVTFVASLVPTFVGGIVLSGLADRLPRREVMIFCDLSRAALVAVMALPGIPLGALVALLFLVTMIGAPYRSARSALCADILAGDRFVMGTAVTLVTIQVAEVLGFGVGGALVSFFGVRTSLVADAATFVVSALLTIVWVRARPPAAPGSHRAWGSFSGLRAGIRLVFGDPRLRTPMLLGWLAAFLDVYEGVAVPLAAGLGGGAVAVGLILASGSLGAAAGATGFSRLVPPATRVRLMGPLAIASCAVLILFASTPSLLAALVILTVSGVLGCYQVAASSAFIAATPPGLRGQGFGIAQGGMCLGQGAAMVLAGAAVSCHYFSPAAVIALGGALGVIAGCVIVLSRSGTGKHRARGVPQAAKSLPASPGG